MSGASDSKPRLTITLTGVGIAAIVGAIPGIIANFKGEPKAELAYERLSKEVEEMSKEQRWMHDRLIKMEAYWELREKRKPLQCGSEVKPTRIGSSGRKMLDAKMKSRKIKSFLDSPKSKSPSISLSPPPSISSPDFPQMQQRAPAIRKMPPLEFKSKK